MEQITAAMNGAAPWGEGGGRLREAERVCERPRARTILSEDLTMRDTVRERSSHTPHIYSVLYFRQVEALGRASP